MIVVIYQISLIPLISDLNITGFNDLSHHALHMYQPYSLSTNWTINFKISPTPPSDAIGNPGYDIYFRKLDSSRHVLPGYQDGVVPFTIGPGPEERHAWVLNINFILPGPAEICDSLDALCVKISPPKELTDYDIYDNNRVNNVGCVQFKKKCQLPVVGKSINLV